MKLWQSLHDNPNERQVQSSQAGLHLGVSVANVKVMVQQEIPQDADRSLVDQAVAGDQDLDLFLW